MARKSRKAGFVNVGKEAGAAMIKEEKPVFRAGLYARLSLESEANKERGTIENQMELLKKFVDGADDIVVEREYMDISQTGTNFDRGGFEEMMRDIRDGRINCVVVKDLSRLGRNYVEAGNYVERVFPFFEVRFIAVTDGYDSAREGADLSVCMANIFNEFYSRDLAKKIKAAYRANWKKGSNVCGNLAYGLMSDPLDKHHIVADPDTAPVVARIFAMFVDEKMGYAQIAKTLNDEGVIGPKAYKHFKRTKELPENYNPEWRGGTVSRMLCNPYYAGDSRHNEHGRDGFAEKKQWREPEENWIIMEDTHDPIVPRALYLKAQERLKEIHENSPKYGKKNEGELACRNFYKKKIVCGDCGATMYLIKNSSGAADFVCGGHQTKKGCSRKSVSEGAVNDEVLRVIRAHMNVYVDSVGMLRRMNRKAENMKKYDVLSKEIQKLHHGMEKVAAHRQRLYEDYAERLIDAEQYEAFADKDAAEEAELRRRINEVTEYQKKYGRNYCASQDWETAIQKYRNIRHLTKKMVDAFVEKIEIFSAGKVTVHLLYDDMLEELVAYTKERMAAENG
ncbi:MAG: recombinase family protein [Acetatifactor muris]|nr:recombinase family protein [Acetatifactor muris]